MRERLTFAFIVLTVVLLLGAGVVRTYVLRDLIREQSAGQLGQEAALIGSIVEDRQAAGGTVDEAFLTSLVGPKDRLEYDPPGADDAIVVHGDDYAGDDDLDQDISARSAVTGGSIVTVSESPSVVRDIIGRDLGSIGALFLLIAVVAAALGRGRFDLDLPKTKVPEALAISNALRSSAFQLEDRVHRERAFAE